MLRNKKTPDMCFLNAIDTIAVNTNMKKKKQQTKNRNWNWKPMGPNWWTGNSAVFWKWVEKVQCLKLAWNSVVVI